LRLLGTIAADPKESVGRLELLAPQERRQLLLEWNDTARDLPQVTLPALFEAQMERSPQGIALVFEQSTLSHAELNLQANRLAHLLIGRGVGPENLVALALPCSTDMIIAVMAILKSRGCLPAPGSGVSGVAAGLYAPGRSAGLCPDKRSDR
jgi:non-ribosomal peptide synthetase component F